jgi:CheY-like chemotaxis protein
VGHALNQALVIEDEDRPRELAMRRLEELGCEVHVARNGVEGMELLRAGLRASVILVDLFMPELDAVGFRRQQLATVEFAEIPTVLLTTTELGGSVAGSIGLPLLKKPFGCDDLVAAIKAAEQPLRGRSVRSSWL